MANDLIVFGAELDPRKLERGVDRANSKLRSLDQTSAKTGRALKVLGGVAAGIITVAAVRRVASLSLELFKLGAAANATASRFRTVFGDSTKAVEGFNREFSKISGLSTQQFQDVAARLGAIAQGMGFAQAASADFALELVKLSADLASFNDLPVEDVAHRIAAALTGERESLKRLGVVITEVEVQQRVLANTGKESVKAITQQEKATATLQLITEKAGVAVGDLARTSQEIDNVVKQLNAAWKDFNDTLGKFISQSPLVRDFLAQVRDAIQNVTTVLSGEEQQILDAFGALGDLAGNAFSLAFLKAIESIHPGRFEIFGQEFVSIELKLIQDSAKQAAENIGFALDRLNAVAREAEAVQRFSTAATEDYVGQARKVAAALDEVIDRRDKLARERMAIALPKTPEQFDRKAELDQLISAEDSRIDRLRHQLELLQQQLAVIEKQSQVERARELAPATGAGPFAPIYDMAERAERRARIFGQGLERQQLPTTPTGGGPYGGLLGMAGTAQRRAQIFAGPEAQFVGGFAGINAMTEAIRNADAAAMDAGENINDMQDVWQTGFRGMSIILSDFITGGIEGFDDLGDAILRMFQRLALEKSFETIGTAVGLGFQSGGIVPGPIGAPQLAVVHGGEEVVPVHRTQRDSVTVSQNINFNISALDAPSVQQLLTQQKGTITAVVAEAINDSDTIRRLIQRR